MEESRRPAGPTNNEVYWMSGEQAEREGEDARQPRLKALLSENVIVRHMLTPL